MYCISGGVEEGRKIMEEITVAVAGPTEQAPIVKGKRTKRQRLDSPIPLAITAANSSTGDIGSGDHGNDKNALNSNSSSAGDEFVDSATEDEEEMANCLILLAQGHFRDLPNPREEFTAEPFRFSSKRYVEKVGIYVYDCKTCGRTFPSFQALGGHRASHKKPRGGAAEEKKSIVLFSDDDYYDEPKGLFGAITTTSNKYKVHECSICGSEFASGQALGGHMRRHRGPLTISTNTNLSLSPLNTIKMDSEDEKQPNSALTLDLNLPAPEELGFASKQQKSLVLSNAPTLVDCHY